MGYGGVMCITWEIDYHQSNHPIRCKHENIGHIVIMSPPIVKTLLDLGVSSLLEIQLDAIHGAIHLLVRQSGVFLPNGRNKGVELILCWHDRADCCLVS